MKENLSKPSEVEKGESEVQKGARDLFDRWNAKAKIDKSDDLPTRLKKIGIRIGGIILLMLFSPLLAVIFVFVILAAL
jgi:hypothetical protein